MNVNGTNGRVVPDFLTDKGRLVWGALFTHEYQSETLIAERLKGLVSDTYVNVTLRKLRHAGWLRTERVERGEPGSGRGRRYKHKALAERLIVPALLPEEVPSAERAASKRLAKNANAPKMSPIERAHAAIAAIERAGAELDSAMLEIEKTRQQIAALDEAASGVAALRQRLKG